MNRLSRWSVVLAVLALGCSGPGGNTPVELSERVGLQVDGGGAYQLVSAPLGPPLTTQGDEATVAIVGSPRGDGSIIRFRGSTRPSGNGGQWQQMTFERTDFGSSDGGVQVPYLPTAFCGSAATCPTSYGVGFLYPKALVDRSIVLAGTLSSANPEVGFESPRRLLRFSTDGALLVNAPIDVDRLAPLPTATGLENGALVVAYSRGAGYSSLGVGVELRAGDTGALTSTSTLDSSEVDGGVSVPARVVPSVAKLVPLRGGGFLAVGQIDMTRDIACGSQDDATPKPGGCGQGITHGLLARFDAQGKLLWRRDLGRDWAQPGSYFVDAAELSDGSLVATGHVEKRTDRWLEPDHGALVARFSADGAVLRATRFCPCTQFTVGGGDALAMNPRAVENGGYELMFRDGKRVATAARFDAADQLVGAAVSQWPSPLFGYVPTESGWASYADGKVQLMHHELVPR